MPNLFSSLCCKYLPHFASYHTLGHFPNSVNCQSPVAPTKVHCNTYNTYHYGLLPPLCYRLHVCVVQIHFLGKDHCYPPISHKCLHHLLLLSRFPHWCLLFPQYFLECLLQVLSVKHHLQRETALNLNAIFTRILCTLFACTHGVE